MLQRYRESRLVAAALLVGLAACGAGFLALREWLGVALVLFTLVAILPTMLAKLSRSDGPLRWSFTQAPKAKQIATGAILMTGFGVWQVVRDGWIAVPFLSVGLAVFVVWFVRTLFREGWSGASRSADTRM